MVEAIIALLILASMGAVIILLMVQIASLNNAAKLRNQANSYVEQGMEQVRGFVQNNGWSLLAAKGSGSGTCYPDGTLSGATVTCIAGGLAKTTCGVGNGAAIPAPLYPASYTRTVKVTVSGSQAMITSTVCWLEKSLWNKTESVTYYYNY